jgi:hypothetical protein
VKKTPKNSALQNKTKNTVRTIKSGTADKKWYLLQYLKKESTESLKGEKNHLKILRYRTKQKTL